jgi:hypothetical protein
MLGASDIYATCYGLRYPVCGLWLAAILVENELVVGVKLTQMSCLEVNASENLQQSIGENLNYLISFLYLKAGREPKLHMEPNYLHGILGKEVVVTKNAWSDLVLSLAKTAYDLETNYLDSLRPEYGIKVFRTHNFLDLTILESGPIIGIRKSHLQRVPKYWLKLLKRGNVPAECKYWHITPPDWWVETFNVPWWYWYSATELNYLRNCTRARGLPQPRKLPTAKKIKYNKTFSFCISQQK